MKSMIAIPLLAVLLTLASCGGKAEPTADMANPASTLCVELGYRHEIRTATDGSQQGFCLFPDGSECDEWSFYRGECGPQAEASGAEMANPASSFCVEQGYELEIRTAADGSQQGFCLFPDGTECEEWAFFRGECGPGTPQP
jgi:putative hemolysin